MTRLSRPKNTQELLAESLQYFQLQDYTAARSTLVRLLEQDKSSAEAWSNLGYIAYLQSDMSMAIRASEEAILIAPNFVAAYSNLAIALMASRRVDDAIAVLQQGLAIDPQFADLQLNLGVAYQQRHHITSAIGCLQAAIKLVPRSADAYCNLASCYQDAGLIDPALASYVKALAYNPDHAATISNYLMCLQYHPHRTSKELRLAAMKVTETMNQLDSIHSLAPIRQTNPPVGDTSRLVTETSRLVSDVKKWRIGFVCADFRAHPVGWFFISVFKSLAQKHNVELFCYHNSLLEDSLTQEFERHAAGFHRISGKNDEAVINTIRTDGIDILIDLAGHTAGNRLSLFARRAAPLQLSWLGYPATTAIAAMDAVILSEDLVTESTPRFFTETIAVISGSQFVYVPPEYLPNVAPCPCVKNKIITFGCFNNLSKINDAVVVLWAKILHAVPESQLLLKWKTFEDAQVCDYFFRRFHSLGIGRARLQLRGASPHVEMLNEYADMDIALDPFPFSGALTSFEATWMGVPIVTLYGERPISRQTFSINKALSLDHLSTTTPANYIVAASNLANNTSALIELRKSLRQRAVKSVLCDADAMASELFARVSSMRSVLV